jgi:glutaredoxin-like protein
MIPLRDQQLLRERLQRDLAGRVRIDYFYQKPAGFYIAGRQECAYCEDVKTLLQEIASLSERLTLTLHDIEAGPEAAKTLGVDKVPATVIRGQANRPLRFFGVPAGTGFINFIETIVEASTGVVQLLPETVKQLRRLKQDVSLQILTTPACTYSPMVARIACKLALQSVHIKLDVVEISEYPALLQRYNVRVTPTIVIDDSMVLPGTLTEADLVQAIFRHVEGKPISGTTRVAHGTPFSLPTPEQQKVAAQQQNVRASGLIIPGR